MGERVLTELGEQMRSWLPVVFRDSPDHLAVINALSREMERAEDAIEQVRRQFVPQTADVLLGVHEAKLGLTIEPVGVSLEERREVVLATETASTAMGSEWVTKVTQLVGPGWSYEEHIPGDVTSPPENTIRIVVPFAPGAGAFGRAKRLIEAFTPAHLDVIVTSATGFTLDESQLDQEGVQ